MVAVSNIFDLFSTICRTEDVLIVSSGAVTSALHEGDRVSANIGDPQSDDDFFPHIELLFRRRETDLELVTWMPAIRHGNPNVLRHLLRSVGPRHIEAE